MTTSVIAGGELITPKEHRFANLWLNAGSIEQIRSDLPEPDLQAQVIDASQCFVTPGLFDIQVNGDPECDLWADPQQGDLEKLRKNLARAGVTSFLATLITDDVAHLRRNIDFLSSQAAAEDPLNNGAAKPMSRIAGIHLEGPCLSPQRPGVHPPQWLKPLSVELMERLISPGVKLMTVAPELDPSGKTLLYLRDKGVQVALGHSNATLEEARQAFSKDVHLMTHTFNALPPLHHRAAGAIGAAILDDDVTCCLICDGLHVCPEVSSILIKLKGPDRIILVSDAAHTGTSKGGLVGSSIHLSEAVRNVVKWHAASFIDAIRMATWNPAKAIGESDRIGELAPGKHADIVLWDKQTLQIKQVFVGGQLIA